MKEVSCQIAKDQNRPVVYVPSAGTDKDELARQIAAKDKITTGLVAILTCVEPCMSFEIYRNKDEKKLELVPRLRKCLFLYHYYLIQKVPRTHRYLITPRGRDILSAVLAAHRIRLDQLNKLAA